MTTENIVVIVLLFARLCAAVVQLNDFDVCCRLTKILSQVKRPPRQLTFYSISYILRCTRCIMSRQSLKTLLMFSVSTAQVKWG